MVDFALSESQEMLKRTARDFLSQESPKSLTRELEADFIGFSPQLLRQMADLGWLGLIIPEQYDGGGASFLDLTVLMEEIGRQVVVSPFLYSVTGAMMLLEGGSEEQKRSVLPKVSKLGSIIALAIAEADAKWQPSSIKLRATQDGNDYVLNGTKSFVEYAHVADYILCVARTSDGRSPEEGITVFLLDNRTRGMKATPLETTAADKQCEVVFTDARVPKENIVGQLDGGWPLVASTLDKAIVLLCAECVGGAQQTHEMTVDYAKMRIQFGRPLGSFQAVQHMCADQAIWADGIRFTTYEAAWYISQGLPAAKAVATAKSYVPEAYRRICRYAHQIIAGIGFMKEYDLHFYSRRAKVAELKFGSKFDHRERVAAALGV